MKWKGWSSKYVVCYMKSCFLSLNEYCLQILAIAILLIGLCRFSRQGNVAIFQTFLVESEILCLFPNMSCQDDMTFKL